MASPLQRALRGFVTERAGSVYHLQPDGTTVRTKAASPGHPLHQDAGIKRPSISTFYLVPDAVPVATSAYARGKSPLSGRPLSMLVVANGQPVYRRMQFERGPPDVENRLPGKPLRELGYREQPLITEPEPRVGLSPLEFFDDGFHLGSPISRLFGVALPISAAAGAADSSLLGPLVGGAAAAAQGEDRPSLLDGLRR